MPIRELNMPIKTEKRRRKSTVGGKAFFMDGVPRTVIDSFKAECYKRGSNMKAELTKFMIAFANGEATT